LVVGSRIALAGGSTSRTTVIADLSQLSGVQTASQGSLATQVPAGQFSNIGARLSALRFGTQAIAGRGSLISSATPSATPIYDSFHVADDHAGGFYTKDGGEALFRHASMMESGSSADSKSPAVANPWGFFVEGGYGWGNRDQTINENGFKFDSFSVTGGMDYNFGNAVLGASVGYDRYKANFDNSTVLADGSQSPGGSSRVNGVSGSIFGAWFGEHWSINGIGSFGRLSSNLSRTVSYQSALSSCPPNLAPCGATQILSGSPEGNYGALGATVAYDANAGPWTITPSASLNYRQVRINGYTESNSQPTGGLALIYDEQTIGSFRSIVGLHVSRAFSEKFGVITPSFKAEWDHEFRDSGHTLTMKFANDPYTPGTACGQYCFSIPTDDPAGNYGIVGAGLSALFAQRLQAYVYYERVVGVSYLKSNAISVGLRGQF
jgi:outer membrane autotransporter protein